MTETSYKQCPYVSKRKINVKEFIENWTNELSEELSWLNTNELIKNDLRNENIKQNIDKQMKFFFRNISNLNLPDDNKKIDQTNNVVKYLLDEEDKAVNIKNRHQDDCNHEQPLAVLTVQIFKQTFKYKNRLRIYLDREFKVLSCQLLTTLRDSYFCPMDHMDKNDFSDTPKFEKLNMIEHEKTGFFFIENTFHYDDRQSIQNLDDIIKWYTDRIGACSKKPMSSTRFEELTIQLGYPYLYLHRNNCEHWIVFSDCQLFQPKLEQPVDRYPKITLTNTCKIKCQMCSIYYAKWFTLNHNKLPISPFYFCQNCFITFNYDSDGQKTASFKAFPIMLC